MRDRIKDLLSSTGLVSNKSYKGIYFTDLPSYLLPYNRCLPLHIFYGIRHRKRLECFNQCNKLLSRSWNMEDRRRKRKFFQLHSTNQLVTLVNLGIIDTQASHRNCSVRNMIQRFQVLLQGQRENAANDLHARIRESLLRSDLVEPSHHSRHAPLPIRKVSKTLPLIVFLSAHEIKQCR